MTQSKKATLDATVNEILTGIEVTFDEKQETAAEILFRAALKKNEVYVELEVLRDRLGYTSEQVDELIEELGERVTLCGPYQDLVAYKN